MNRICALLSDGDAKVLHMGRLYSVCHRCKWSDSRMVNPKNKRDINEVERLIRAAHAVTGCPEEPRVIRASI